MDIYSLSRNYWDWAFENPEKVSPSHAAIYFFAIEHCNRLGWKSKFGFPSQMTMEAIGIKKHSTYIQYFNDLVSWGFFKLIEKSKNQYSANIISLSSAVPKNGKALGKARAKHGAKQGKSTGQSKGSIDIQYTNIQLYLDTIKQDDLNFTLPEWICQDLETWLSYKKERRETYVKTGFKSLVGSIQKNYPNGKGFKEAVESSISNNYSGLFPAKSAPQPSKDVSPLTQPLPKEEDYETTSF